MMQCLRKNESDEESGGDKSVDIDLDPQHTAGDDSLKILCETCRAPLTTVSARTRVDGAHRHVKVNPHGHVYHVACFHPVSGVLPIGEPSAEFSWFAGYRWQIALCGGCQIHLGWQFTGNGSFGALIEGRFVEEEQRAKG